MNNVVLAILPSTVPLTPAHSLQRTFVLHASILLLDAELELVKLQKVYCREMG